MCIEMRRVCEEASRVETFYGCTTEQQSIATQRRVICNLLKIPEKSMGGMSRLYLAIRHLYFLPRLQIHNPVSARVLMYQKLS